LRGHEFHYSRIVTHGQSLSLVFRMTKGQGIVTGWDGLCYKNTLASYTHLHARGNEHWVEAMVGNALRFREHRGKLPESTGPARDPEAGILQVSKRLTMI
jgi:cobyrinic acid a,c-diamide synthase